MKRRVGMLIFPGFQLLDLSGPLAALEVGGNCASRPYQLTVYATQAGIGTSSCGVGVAARRFASATVEG